MPSKYLNTFTLGADPEFMVLNAEDPDQAYNVEDPPRNSSYDDPDLETYDETGNEWGYKEIPGLGEIGLDHAGSVVELRPEPSKSSYRLIQRVQKLLCAPSFLSEIRGRKFSWVASGGPKPKRFRCLYDDRTNRTDESCGNVRGNQSLAGHVHFGPPSGSSRESSATTDYYSTHCRRGPLQVWGEDMAGKVERLDWGVVALEHAGVLPLREALVRRLSGPQYGSFRNWQLSLHSYEYRTPTSWLSHPASAFTVLTLLKLILLDNDFMQLDPTDGLSGIIEYMKKHATRDTDAKRFVAMISDIRSPKTLLVRDCTKDFKPYWAIGKFKITV